jgi:hypothetical protein
MSAYLDPDESCLQRQDGLFGEADLEDWSEYTEEVLQASQPPAVCPSARLPNKNPSAEFFRCEFLNQSGTFKRCNDSWKLISCADNFRAGLGPLCSLYSSGG